MIREGKDNPQKVIGARYTISSGVEELAEFATYIFCVRIGDVFLKLEGSYVTAYKCTVTKILKKEPGYKGNIIITFWDETVEQGKEYLVMAEDTGENSMVFPLSAKDYSVYPIDEAMKIPVRKSLLDTAVEVEYTNETNSYLEDLEEEWEAGVLNGELTEFYYMEGKDLAVFFNGIVYKIKGIGDEYSALISPIPDFGTAVQVNDEIFSLYNEDSGVWLRKTDDGIEISVDRGESFPYYFSEKKTEGKEKEQE